MLAGLPVCCFMFRRDVVFVFIRLSFVLLVLCLRPKHAEAHLHTLLVHFCVRWKERRGERSGQLCYAMLCYAMLCYAMLMLCSCYVQNSDPVRG